MSTKRSDIKYNRRSSIPKHYSNAHIEQVNESQEATIIEVVKPQQTPLNMELLEEKKQLLRRFFSCWDYGQRKSILKQWPNCTIQQLLTTHNILQLKNRTFVLGSTQNNLLTGPVLLLYSATRFFQGTFCNSCKHGPGMESLSNGVYIGNYVNNKPQGNGAFYWANGDTYQGEFVGGVKQGSGRWTSKTQTYVGEWRDNRPEGLGVIVTEESRYEGEVRGGMKHGSGREMFVNGDVYVGCYVNGRPEGVGQYVWGKTKARYKGFFKNGLRHGVGVWQQGKDRYEGQYQNDKKTGNGKFFWASGNKYQGEFFDDLRHGHGDMTWADGSRFKGEWRYGVQNGLGELYQKGKPVKRGVFQNNVLVTEQYHGKIVKNQNLLKASEKFRNRNVSHYDVKAQPISLTSDLYNKARSYDSKKLTNFMNRTMPKINRYHSEVESEESSELNLKKKKRLLQNRRKSQNQSTKKYKSQIASEEDLNPIQWTPIRSRNGFTSTNNKFQQRKKP